MSKIFKIIVVTVLVAAIFVILFALFYVL